MILMQHDIGVQWFDGSKEKRQVSLTVYGDSSETGFSAMAKTVGLPTGIATKMVLTGNGSLLSIVVLKMSQGTRFPLFLSLWRVQ